MSFTAKERLYPVADATTFFTDMHYILRVLAAGDIRTVCHHRLNLLEQVIFFVFCSFKCVLFLHEYMLHMNLLSLVKGMMS